MIYEDKLGSKIEYYPKLAKILGSVKTAIFLCNIINYVDWFTKTQEEIYNETALTRLEQETARKKLKELGIIEEKYSGIPRKLYFKINHNRFYEIITEVKNA